MKYRAEIDGLRAVAVVPVILFHAGLNIFTGGYVGVDVFFVISGYLITGILLNEIDQGKFSIAKFYERRARRILPALSFVILCCIPPAALLLSPDQLSDFAASVIAVSFFSSNILFWTESGYFAPASEENPLLHTWSLAVEEQYYLLFPVFLLMTWRFGWRRVFLLILGVSFLSLSLSEIGWRFRPTANFYLAPTRAWELLAGSMCAFLHFRSAPKINEGLAAIGLGLVVYAIIVFDKSTPFPSVYTLVPVAGTAMVVLYAGRSTWTARVLSTKPFVGLGLISYSAYLWHQPIFAFARVRAIQPPSYHLMMPLAFLSMALAFLSWRFVEQPFRRRGWPPLRTRNSVFGASLAITAAFVSLGAFVIQKNGLPNRQSPEIRAALAKVETVGKERLRKIRSGECQFNQLGPNQTIEDFLANWNCYPKQSNGLTATGIAIYGDSIAGDLAIALRENGLSPMQMAGAHCSLVPSQMNYRCRQIADSFKSRIQEQSIDQIWLANSFKAEELSLTAVRSLIDYWNDLKKPIVLFSPRPVFFKFGMQFARHEAFGQSFLIDLEDHERFFQPEVVNLLSDAGINIVNTAEIFCSIGPDCNPAPNSEPLLTDRHHFSVLGATAFGQSLLTHLRGHDSADIDPYGVPSQAEQNVVGAKQHKE